MARYAEQVEHTVRSLGEKGERPVIFETAEQVSGLMHSVSCGLCCLVQDDNHNHKFHDTRWGVMIGIELTDSGKEFNAQTA